MVERVSANLCPSSRHLAPALPYRQKALICGGNNIAVEIWRVAFQTLKLVLQDMPGQLDAGWNDILAIILEK